MIDIEKVSKFVCAVHAFRFDQMLGLLVDCIVTCAVIPLSVVASCALAVGVLWLFGVGHLG